MRVVLSDPGRLMRLVSSQLLKLFMVGIFLLLPVGSSSSLLRYNSNFNHFFLKLLYVFYNNKYEFNET